LPLRIIIELLSYGSIKKSNMDKKKYLTFDEAENLKDACKTSEERSIVRDLIDTGKRLDEVLKERSKFPPNLYE
jgi:predicted AAA+ superfamily ATPase